MAKSFLKTPSKWINYGVIVILVLGILFGYAYYYAVSSPYLISSKDAKQRILSGDFDVILDVRTDLERNTLGFFPGSVHIQSADLEKKMPALYPDKNTRILAYCNTGQRARAATEKLHKLGYNNALYIATQYTTLQ
jgi:rhodanese-related sulfurtransferase